MRALTTDELAAVVHDASSVDVRARGRLALLRVALPEAVDPEAGRVAIVAALADTPLGPVDVIVQPDPGEPRVLGAVFDGR
ncbi:MAG: hypothetical protein H6733_01765 [Alphaproteobacteria bacterium]|nr:hypothetical protein [Alphaproteobacteria bacterium]